MNYCKEVVSFRGNIKYFCDWNGNLYNTYQYCYSNCAYYTLDNEPIPIAKADILFLGGIAGILFGSVFLFALFKSLL